MPPKKAKASKNPINNPHLFFGIHLNNMLHPGDHPIARQTAFTAQNTENAVIFEDRPNPILASTAPTAPMNISILGLYLSPRYPEKNCPRPKPKVNMVNKIPNSVLLKLKLCWISFVATPRLLLHVK